MINNKKGDKMKNVLTLQTILDENTKIETITDKETLKNALRKIIGAASYTKIKHEDMVSIMKEIFVEFDVK